MDSASMTAAPEIKAVPDRIEDAFDGFMSAFEAFKDANDVRLGEIEKKLSADIVTRDKVDRINEAMDEQKKAIDQLVLKKARPALGKGGFRLQETSDSLISYVRSHGGEAIFCAFNLGADPLVAALPEGEWQLIDGTGFAGAIVGRQAELPPHQALFAERVANSG